MSCICEGGFHPDCRIHKEVKLDLNREQLDGLLWLMKTRQMRDNERDDKVLRRLKNRLLKLKKKLNA